MAMNLEQFCKAIDIIVSERLSNLSFDTTMICTITDDSDKDNGHYIVSDGTIRFDAYTNDTSYKKNDQVRVSVLNGDFNERKFIEGPYVGDASGAPVTYISPLGTALPLEENMLAAMGSPQNISSFQIHTNTEDEVLIWEVDISNDSKYQALQENGIYNTLTLSADFMTNLGTLSQGNYGLVLDLFIKKSKDDDAYDHKYITFDSSEMIGNPYSFELYSHQEKKINIAAFGMISMIRLSAYEGIYFDDDGRLEGHRIENPFIDSSGNILPKTPINIRNIKLGFGNDLISITNNTLQLYTTSPIYYNYHEPTDETNNKTLGLVWLNKTDTNEYLGYSDGIYDPDYDEIAYRQKAHRDSRLTAQMNKTGIADDEESLTLAADIAEAEAHMIKAYDLLTTDLSQVMQALGRQLTGAPAILEHLNKLIKNWDSGVDDADGNAIMNAPLLSSYRYDAQHATQKLIQFYSQILNYGYNIQNQITPNDWNKKAIDTRVLSTDYADEQTFYVNENDAIAKKNDFNGVVNWDYNKYYSDFVDGVNNGIQAVRDFFIQMTALTAPGEVLNGYSGIRETYNNRAEAVISVIQSYLDQVDKLCNGDVAVLQNYKTKTDYNSYDTQAAADELAADDNKYCIYWYQYEPKFVLEYDDTEGADNTEYSFGNFAGVNWKRIEYFPITYNSLEDFNADDRDKYIETIDSKKEIVYVLKTTWDKNTRYYVKSLNVGLPLSKQNSPAEDGQYHYVAQALEDEYTTNLYLNPNTQEEKIKVIMFRNHEMITSNIIEFENQDDVPDDKLIDPTDVLRIEHDVDSQEHYQVYSAAYDLVNISDGSKMRQLRCYYDGILSGDETLIDGWLYWYIPTNATLLTYDKDYLVNTLGFSTDADGKTEYSLDNYIYFAKKVLAKDDEEEQVEEEEDVVKVPVVDDTTRTFIYKIKSFYEPSAVNNTILVKARIPGYTESINGEKSFTFSTFGNSGTKYTFAIVPNSNRVGYSTDNGDTWERGLNLTMTLKDADDSSIQMITGVPSDGASSVGSSLNVGFIAPSGRVLPEENYNEINDSLDWSITLNDPSWDTNEAVKNFIGVLKATVSLYNDTTKGDVTLSTLYSVPYSANPQYYISGPTAIIYNNQGTVSRISEEPFKLFEHTVEGDKVVENTIWKLDYYTSNGDLVNIGDGEAQQNNIYAYMPKLNKDNTLTPAPMYFTYETESASSGSQEYYPVAKCYSGDTLLWSQPIIITQNKYASAMLNNWDGTFTIDEANGTLMATMLGAGKKTANNTFEGVLIGDITAGDGFDPDNANGIGIYGFNDGDQSFHFGVDGTAFLGKAGRGRILFDGNSGTISSASYQQNRIPIYEEDAEGNEIITGYQDYGTSGMMIDLDDGFIDMLGSVRTTDSKYAPLKYQSIKITDIENVTSNLLASDIGFMRYEKTWYDEDNKAIISNFFLEERDEGDFKWNIDDFEYDIVECDVPASYIPIKYPDGANLKENEHRDIYTKSRGVYTLVENKPENASSHTQYYLLDTPAHVAKHIIPTQLTLTPGSDYVLVGTYDSEEEFNNDSRAKYIQSINDSGESIYSIANDWQNTTTKYYVRGIEINDNDKPEKDLIFTYGYNEYLEVDMNLALTYQPIGTFETKEAFDNNTYEKYIEETKDGEEVYTYTSTWTSGTTYYVKNMVSEVYNFYKDTDYDNLYVQDINGDWLNWTYSGDYVNDIVFYEKVRREFTVTIPAGYTATRVVEENRRSNVHIDVLNPYFTISSAKQADTDYIMYVGDNRYYLQSVNYTPGTFNKTINNIEAYEGAPFHADGAGMKIDLNSGHIDAYDFNLTSKNIFLDSGNTADPFMIVRDNKGKVLIYMGTNNYFLKSSDFKTMDKTLDKPNLGSGMKLDLVNGGIEAYGFNLRAGQTDGNDHEIIITDKGDNEASPYFAVNTSANGETKTLVMVSKTAQYFQSANFSIDNKTGIGLSLSPFNSYLKAYDGFSLQAYAPVDEDQTVDKTKGIFLDSTATIYPLIVIGTAIENEGTDKEAIVERYFKVSWSGQIEAQGGIFNNINVESGVLGDLDVTGTLEGGTILGANVYAATLYAGGTNAGSLNTGSQLRATSSGVYIQDAVISNCQITNGGNSGGVTYINNSSMGSKNGSFDDLKVYNTLVVNAGTLGSITDPGDPTGGDNTETAAIYNAREVEIQPIQPWDPSDNTTTATKGASVVIDGTTTISGATTIGTGAETDILTINGTTTITGKTTIGAENESTELSLEITGTTKMGGNIGINTDPGENIGLTIDGTTYLMGNIGINVEPDENWGLKISGSMTTDADVHYFGNIYCHDTAEDAGASGKDAVLHLDDATWFIGSTYLQFHKGILVSTEAPEDTSDDVVTIKSSLPAIAKGDVGKALTVTADNPAATGWTKFYAPTTTGTNNQLWATVTSGETTDANWVSLSTIMGAGSANQVWAADATVNGTSQGNFYTAGWKTIFAPTSKGAANEIWTSTGTGDASAPQWKSLADIMGAGSAGQVWAAVASGGVGTAPAVPGWKTIDATLVNFTEDTSVEATDTAGVYNVSVDYSGKVTDTVSGTATATGSATYPGYYLGWGTYYPDGGAGGTRIYSTEKNSNSYSESWMLDHYEFVTKAQSRTYSPTCTATYEENVELEYGGTTTGSVQIKVGLT